jgi:two-component system, cell cycle sensor histidine kinase and response regulator CckA
MTTCSPESESAADDNVSWRELLRHLPVAVVVYEAVDDGEDFVIREFNQTAERIEGVAKEQVIGRCLSAAFPRVRELGLFSALQRVWRTGKPEHHPASLYEGGRKAGWRENHVFRIPGGELVAVYDDVSGRKQVALLQAIRQVTQVITRERNRESLLQNACLGLTSTRSYYTAWIGLLDAQVGAMRLFQSGLGEDAAALQERLVLGNWPQCVSRALGEREVVAIGSVAAMCGDCPISSRCKDGHTIAARLEHEGMVLGVVVVSMPRELLPDPDELSLFRAVVSDMAAAFHALQVADERAAAERALQESQQRYRSLFDALDDAAFLADVQTGRILDANRRAEALLGRPRSEIVGMRQAEFHPAEKVDAAGEPFGHAVQNDLADHNSEVIRKDGTIVPVTIKASTFSLSGRFLAVSLLRDVTEQKQLQAQFRQAQKMEAIGRLAGGVAHDFNNLLTAITGFSELLKSSLDADDPRHDDIDEVLRSADRAAGLTRQLLAFSRRQVLQPQVLFLNDVVGETSKMLKRVIGEDIELRLELAPELDAIEADPGQVHQVIMNLAVNARDAMPKGGKLTIETRNLLLGADQAPADSNASFGPHVMLAVSDTGVGMDRATISCLFEPFFTTKPKGQGTGLGLATVYGIVQQSGGQISVDSEPGRGSTFRICFPRTEKTAAEISDVPDVVRAPRGDETVLVVEDDEAVRCVVRRTLTKAGYAILEASSAEEALTICENHREQIHLVLTDVVLPGLGGPELAARLTGDCAQAAVLYMSGYTDRALVHHGVLDKGTHFLHKPFTPSALARKVRAVLDNQPDAPHAEALPAEGSARQRPRVARDPAARTRKKRAMTPNRRKARAKS